MIQIKPVSDLRNRFTEIENIVSGGEPVYLTKNGYGTMVVLSIEEYSRLADNSIDAALMEADKAAAQNSIRLSSEEVLSGIRRRIDEYRK